MRINNTITKEKMLRSFMNFSQLAVDMVGALCSHFPSQCCSARFGELAAINNIGRTKRRARSEKKNKQKQKKKQRWAEVSQQFLSKTVVL